MELDDAGVNFTWLFVPSPDASEVATRETNNKADTGNGNRRMGRARFTVRWYFRETARFNQKTLRQRERAQVRF